MTELKRCPFCGGEAVVDRKPAYGYEPAVSFEVSCSKCGQRRVGGYFDTVYKSEKWARRKAIEAWNTRPNSWHTGTPTEQGWYLLKLVDEYGRITYDANYLRKCIKGMEWKYAFFGHVIIKWQSIEDEPEVMMG